MSAAKDLPTHEGRVLSWIRVPHDERDKRDHVLMALPDAPRPKIVVNHRVRGILDQGQEGACTGFAYARVIYDAFMRAGIPLKYWPAPAWFYAIGRIMLGNFPKDTGCTIPAVMKAGHKAGIVFEPTFPYTDKSAAKRPSRAVYAEAHKFQVEGYKRVLQSIPDIEATLAAGFVVDLGFDVYENFKPDKNGILPMPKGALRGGHSVVIDSYDATKKLFGFANSWSKGWGLEGRGFFHYEFVAEKALASDLMVVTGVKAA